MVGKLAVGGKKEEGASPPGKRRWRGVWRSGSKKEASKEEDAKGLGGRPYAEL